MTRTSITPPIIILLIISVLLISCKEDDPVSEPVPAEIIYKVDGRSVSNIEPTPLLVDINEDGTLDFNIFFELTADGSGDHLYGGINPLGPHLIKSGPSDENHFLNMGFVISESEGMLIQENIPNEYRWTSDHSTLVIRHTLSDNSVNYEGNWKEGTAYAGFALMIDEQPYFGWMQLIFNSDEETMTLVDYAYLAEPDTPITTGAKE